MNESFRPAPAGMAFSRLSAAAPHTQRIRAPLTAQPASICKPTPAPRSTKLAIARPHRRPRARCWHRDVRGHASRRPAPDCSRQRRSRTARTHIHSSLVSTLFRLSGAPHAGRGRTIHDSRRCNLSRQPRPRAPWAIILFLRPHVNTGGADASRTGRDGAKLHPRRGRPTLVLHGCPPCAPHTPKTR